MSRGRYCRISGETRRSSGLIDVHFHAAIYEIQGASNRLAAKDQDLWNEFQAHHSAADGEWIAHAAPSGREALDLVHQFSFAVVVALPWATSETTMLESNG